MSDSHSSSSSGGIGIFTLLTVIFVVLKLTGVGMVAHWSWWWVLSPLWIGFALWFVVAVLFVGLGALFTWFSNR
jgi:hypothetical protein